MYSACTQKDNNPPGANLSTQKFSPLALTLQKAFCNCGREFLVAFDFESQTLLPFFTDFPQIPWIPNSSGGFHCARPLHTSAGIFSIEINQSYILSLAFSLFDKANCDGTGNFTFEQAIAQIVKNVAMKSVVQRGGV